MTISQWIKVFYILFFIAMLAMAYENMVHSQELPEQCDSHESPYQQPEGQSGMTVCVNGTPFIGGGPSISTGIIAENDDSYECPTGVVRCL